MFGSTGRADLSHRRGRIVPLMISALPLAFSAGGCVIRESPEPAYYQPAPDPVEMAAEPAPYEPPPQQVLVQYDRDLGPYGHWVPTEYGRCWVPNDRPSEWRPYTVGHWEDTDQGWCWVAEGPETDWGVVTYHYGRWYDDPSYGWVWVPGSVWAPAWVAWREGDGYCGWAPLPPQCGEGVNVNVVLVDRYCPPERYVYCDERYIGERGEDRHYERNNITIINRTTNITNITYVNNRVVNRGVEVRNVEERSGRRVERVQLAQADNASEARRLRQDGRPVVYAPPAVQAAARERAPRLERAMTTRQQPVERQPANRAPQYPAQAGGRNNDWQSQREQKDLPAQRQRQFDSQEQARQRQIDNQERLRQQAADRAQSQEQRRAEAQAQQRARQQEAQQREDALRQQRAAERDRQAQNAAAQRQQAAERQQAARDRAAADRAAAERDAPRQRGGQNQGPPQ